MKARVRLLGLACVLPAAPPAAAQAATGPAPETAVYANVGVQTGSGPRLRLEYINVDPHLPPTQPWDLVGDDRGLYVVDLAAFTVPVTIKAGAPTNSLVIAPGGEVGLGAKRPAASLHVRRTNGTAQLLVQETSPTTAERTMMALSGGPAKVRFENTASGSSWNFGTDPARTFSIGGASPAFTLTPSGNLTIAGTLALSSARESKQALQPVDAGALLERLAALPLSTWRYKGDPARHLGPMAQDFSAAFGFGSDDQHIAPSDLAGVGLAAAQALRAQALELKEQIGRLEGQLGARDAELDELEAQLQALAVEP